MINPELADIRLDNLLYFMRMIDNMTEAELRQVEARIMLRRQEIQKDEMPI